MNIDLVEALMAVSALSLWPMVWRERKSILEDILSAQRPPMPLRGQSSGQRSIGRLISGCACQQCFCAVIYRVS